FRSRSTRTFHPFPTRRSSDLVGQASLDSERGPGEGGIAADVRDASEFARDQPVEPDPVEGAHGGVGHFFESDLAQNVGGQPVAQDRKSTRLNSSHEWISYAVF